MTPKQVLRAHIDEMHRPNHPQNHLAKGATLEDMQRWHSRVHWRDGAPNHFHEVDNLGVLVGPSSDHRRPSGWTTGLGVVPKAPQRSILR